MARWGIETTIVSLGVYTSGTSHLANAGPSIDETRASEYAKSSYRDMPDLFAKEYEVIEPVGSDVEDVARAILEVIKTPFGKRPFRIDNDPADAEPGSST